MIIFNVVTVAAYTVSVLEGIAGGTMVLQVTADDADVGVNDDLTFTIASGDPSSEFEILNGILLWLLLFTVNLKIRNINQTYGIV